MISHNLVPAYQAQGHESKTIWDNKKWSAVNVCTIKLYSHHSLNITYDNKQQSIKENLATVPILTQWFLDLHK